MYSNFDVTPLPYTVKHAYIKHAFNKLILIMIFIPMGLKYYEANGYSELHVCLSGSKIEFYCIKKKLT